MGHPPPEFAIVLSTNFLNRKQNFRRRAQHNSGRMDEWGGTANPVRGTKMGKAKLNPNFVSWLMGFPPGFISTESKPWRRWEMESYLCKQRRLLESLHIEQD